MQKSDLNQLFDACRQKFNSNPNPDYNSRIYLLKLLRTIIINNTDAIITAINTDFGCRPKSETQVLEIFLSLQCIDFAIKNLNKWLKPRHHKTSIWFWPSRSYVQPIPRGVVGIISPWNYPLFLTITPLVAAIAAGNIVMIKLSEHVPNISNLLSNILSNIATIILGDSNIAAELSQLPFDHLLFTGATQIGKSVMHGASNNLTSLTLELGGKSPAIIADNITANIVHNIWLGKIFNAGQTCIAPDYLYIPKGTKEKLLNFSKSFVIQKIQSIDNLDYCAILNKTNYDRILDLLKNSIEQGAIWQPLTVGPWHSCDNNIYKIAPGLLFNINNNMKIMQQEIFGPILPVLEFDTISDILNTLKNKPKPLAIYLFTKNSKIKNIFINNTISGALNINSTIVHAAQEDLPFGGVGESGFGVYRGKYGFDTFSVLKPIYKQSRINIFDKFYPPKKPWQKIVLKLMLR